MCGRLARWLRIAGLDTAYRKRVSDGFLIGAALREKRVILTRDTHLGAERSLPFYLLIRSPFWEEQLAQVFTELRLGLREELVFSRCCECNQKLEPVEKESIRDVVPPYVFTHQKNFFRCRVCDKIFWRGSHYLKALEKLRRLTATGRG